MKTSLQKFRNNIQEELDLDVLEDKLNTGYEISRESLFDILSEGSKLALISYECGNLIQVNSVYARMHKDDVGNWNVSLIFNIPQEYRYSKVHSPYMVNILDAITIEYIKSYLIKSAHNSLYSELA